jgi:phosphate:Na+ symporter
MAVIKGLNPGQRELVNAAALILLVTSAGFSAHASSDSSVSSRWSVDIVLGLAGGLGLFLLGMEISAKGFRYAAGDRLRNLLAKATSNRIKSLLFGIVATAFLQSSSASTVMLVGFVSASILTLGQSTGIIIGAKIGTTVTTQIIAFNLSKWALLLIGGGFVIRAVSGRGNLKQWGNVILGFGLIFFGLGTMSKAMEPLKDIPEIVSLLASLGDFPIGGFIIATLFTAVIQSSAATIGIAISLCSNNLLNLEAALPIALGAHVGTCATALLAGIGADRQGKQVAIAHLIISILEVIIVFPFLSYFVTGVKWFSNLSGPASVARELANGHMLFTIVTGLIILPFSKKIADWAAIILPVHDKTNAFKPKYLNYNAIKLPGMALELAHKEILRLGSIVRQMIADSIEMLASPHINTVDHMDKEDDKVDILDKAIRQYLGRVAQSELTRKLLAREHAFVYIVQDLEGIGDLLTKEIAHTGRKLYKKKLSFSPEGVMELRNFHEIILNKYDAVLKAIDKMDKNLARDILNNRQQEREIERSLREAHLGRIQHDLKDSIATSTWHLSSLNNIRSIGERIDDIARTLLEEL